MHGQKWSPTTGTLPIVIHSKDAVRIYIRAFMVPLLTRPHVQMVQMVHTNSTVRTDCTRGLWWFF